MIRAKASNYVNIDKFFYDVEVDYRGRIYYADSFLHYQGSDLAKGLLEFSEGKVMTQQGYRWLLRHIACSYNQSYSVSELEDIDFFEYDYGDFPQGR